MAPRDYDRFAGIKLDYPMIDGALGLMALSSGNNMDQETIRKAGELKRIVSQKSKDDESQGMKLRSIKVTVPKKSRCKGIPKRKIRKLDQPADSPTSGAEPGPSSRASASTSRAEPGPSSRASASTSRAEPGPSSAISTEETRPPALPSLPAGIQELIGVCSRPIRKQIFASDVNHGQCRLMLPRTQVKKERLLDMLNPDYEDIEKGIPVTVYGPDGREYAMIFKLWTGKYHVLKSQGWNQFCQDYGLRSLINTVSLTIWMFRHRQTNHLCFAITW